MYSTYTKRKIFTLICVFFGLVSTYAQQTISQVFTLSWQNDSIPFQLTDGKFVGNNDMSQHFFAKIPTQKVKIKNTRLIPLETENFSISNQVQGTLSDQFDYVCEISEFRGQYHLLIDVNPVKKINGRIERLKSFQLDVEFITDNVVNGNRNPEATFNSVLEKGEFYKISVEKTGIFRLDKDFIETKIGKSISGINPKSIKIYGQRGGMLPEENSANRIDDLKELSIYVEGETDGKFDAGDYVLFYGEGPEKLDFDSIRNNFLLKKNIYDTKNYYFITFEGVSGKRIGTQNPLQTSNKTYNYYDDVQRYEVDETNLLGSYDRTEGAGKEWFGDYFRSDRSKTYTNVFKADYIPSSPCRVYYKFAARSKNSTSINLKIGEKNFKKSISGVNIDDIEGTYASQAVIDEVFNVSTSNPSIILEFPNTTAESEGWLDFIHLEGQKLIDLSKSPFGFRNKSARNEGVIKFSLTNTSNKTIWDVTDPFNIIRMSVNADGMYFSSDNQVHEFYTMSGSSDALTPTFISKVANQNVHSIKDEDMLIVYFSDIKSEAERLKNHHESHSGLKVKILDINEIYNEFSSGKCDPSAIRDLTRLMLYRNPDFKYLLLFGDGTYDYRGLVRNINPENFIPVYETDNSLEPIIAFPSDDYYGLLGDDEGKNLVGSVDIAIGRLPVRNIDEAQSSVDKIIHYETSPDCLGDWRMRLTYCADDQDSNFHFNDMDDIARKDAIRNTIINQNKIYFDSYEQTSTSGENRYPYANQEINQNVFKGVLGMTYLGHGGPLGWAQERVLTVPDILSWNNYDKLMVMTTATCSFGAYDDPSITSPAEHAFLNPKGGAIALLTTTRSVYTNSNKILTNAVHEELYVKKNGKPSSIGEAIMIGKNINTNASFITNSRKFALIGDPAIKIALPKLNVLTTSINGNDPTMIRDTFNALEKITITGIVTDENNVINTSFNGTVYPTVYDKKITVKTKGNDSDSYPAPFSLFKTIIFKGSAEVKNGEFVFSFYVPKNINYTFGDGRISYYATDGHRTDAGGYFDTFTVGGSIKNGILDETGPQVKLYLNDESFINGGISHDHPVLIMDLVDDYGINVTGTAVGQDITAVINNDQQNIHILNDFYESDKGDYTSGKVTFPLSNLPTGKHYITGKAWDISGNSGEARLDFVIANSTDNILQHVLNYPNPFTSSTQFTFEHDFTPTEIDVCVYIYSISGKLVKTITQSNFYNGSRIHDVNWNGKDDFENKLAKGVYLYKIVAHSKELNQTKESKFEKLVIL